MAVALGRPIMERAEISVTKKPTGQFNIHLQLSRSVSSLPVGGVVGDVNSSRGSCSTRRVTYALLYTFAAAQDYHYPSTQFLVYCILLIVIADAKLFLFVYTFVYLRGFGCESKIFNININTAKFNSINLSMKPIGQN